MLYYDFLQHGLNDTLKLNCSFHVVLLKACIKTFIYKTKCYKCLFHTKFQFKHLQVLLLIKINKENKFFFLKH